MQLDAPVQLRVLIPAVENSVDGNSYRPSDVLRSRKGLSVEIGNTDAEGRLVLADALAEADVERPDLLIDMATLTGAARVALGPEVARGIFNGRESARGPARQRRRGGRSHLADAVVGRLRRRAHEQDRRSGQCLGRAICRLDHRCSVPQTLCHGDSGLAAHRSVRLECQGPPGPARWRGGTVHTRSIPTHPFARVG